LRWGTYLRATGIPRVKSSIPKLHADEGSHVETVYTTKSHLQNIDKHGALIRETTVVAGTSIRLSSLTRTATHLASCRQAGAEQMRAIAATVVGEQAANGDTVPCVRGDGRAQELDSGDCFRVGQHEGKGEAGVVIDGDVQGLPAGN
jgi:hypothetical protein